MAGVGGDFDWRWVLSITLAAITLLVEARRQFDKPLNSGTVEYYPLLRGVELRDISTRNEYWRGLVAYCGLYIAIFAIALVSATVYGVSSEAEKEIAGAGEDFGSSELRLLFGDGFDNVTPFYLATTIIAALETGVAAPVERAVRSMAHDLARIPAALFLTLDRLKTADYDNLLKKPSVPKDFQAAVQGRLRNLQGSRVNKNVISEAVLSAFEKAAKEIDIMRAAVLSEEAHRHFSIESMGVYHETVGNIRNRVREVLEQLNHVDKSYDDDKAQEILTRVSSLRGDLFALFALITFKNPPTHDRGGEKESLLDDLHEVMGLKRPTYVDQTTFAALIGGVFGGVIVFLLKCVNRWYYGAVAPSAEFYPTVLSQAAIYAVATSVAWAIATGALTALRNTAFPQSGWAHAPALWTLPFAHFTRLAIAPAIIFALVFTGLRFLDHAWSYSTGFTGAVQILSQYYDYYFFMIILGAVCAWWTQMTMSVNEMEKSETSAKQDRNQDSDSSPACFAIEKSRASMKLQKRAWLYSALSMLLALLIWSVALHVITYSVFDISTLYFWTSVLEHIAPPAVCCIGFFMCLSGRASLEQAS